LVGRALRRDQRAAFDRAIGPGNLTLIEAVPALARVLSWLRSATRTRWIDAA
jgi:hypothetical protein